MWGSFFPENSSWLTEAAQNTQVKAGFPKESLQGNRKHSSVPPWSFTVMHSFLWLRCTVLKVNVH